METARRVFVGIAVLALVGLAVATYVFTAHSLGYRLFCPFATGCDTVQASPYAVLLGLPVSFLGMAGFTTYIVLALVGLWLEQATMWPLWALLALSLVEVTFTVYMGYLQVSVIRAICSWCMLSAGLTLALAGLVACAFFGRMTAGRSLRT